MKWETHLMVIMATGLLSATVCGAEQDTVPKQKSLSIIRFAEGGLQRGYILSATDSTLQFIERKYWKNGFFLQQNSIPAESIRQIIRKNRKKFSMLDGMAIGAGLGIILGFAIGLDGCEGPDNDCTFLDKLFYRDNLRNALRLSTALGGIGAFVGIFTGGKHKTKFTIDGSRITLKKYKEMLLTY